MMITIFFQAGGGHSVAMILQVPLWFAFTVLTGVLGTALFSFELLPQRPETSRGV